MVVIRVIFARFVAVSQRQSQMFVDFTIGHNILYFLLLLSSRAQNGDGTLGDAMKITSGIFYFGLLRTRRRDNNARTAAAAGTRGKKPRKKQNVFLFPQTTRIIINTLNKICRNDGFKSRGERGAHLYLY